MFCSNCGNQIPDGSKFCPNCGSPVVPVPASSAFEQAKEKIASTTQDMKSEVDNAVDSAKQGFNEAGKNIDSAVSEIENEIKGNYSPAAPLKTDRSLIAYILLSLITCGIYGYYFIYTVARDINIACSDDDEETAGLGMFILLSIITCGIYGVYWEYKLGNRLAKNATSFGLTFQENGTTIIMWRIFGCLICFVGTFIGSHILIKNVNAICEAYNKSNHLG